MSRPFNPSDGAALGAHLVERSKGVLPVNTRPLVVDLDSALLCSDFLLESCLAFVRSQPARAFALLLWLASGKAYLKERLAQAYEFDFENMPFDPQVIALIQQERAQGRQIILATASHTHSAERIAAHLKLFDRVLATAGSSNLSANAKRDRLLSEFGERGFDYVGNSHDDLPVWASAQRAYVVNPEPGVEAKARALGNVEAVITSNSNTIKLWAKALRWHQWLKNLLIFVPLLASHQLGRTALLVDGFVAFVLFGLCASSAYLLNDLLDLADDRYHPGKRRRPFASGQLSIKAGLIACPLLLLCAIGGAYWLLPWQFTAALATYYMVTLTYSVWLKRLMVVDAVTLAMLYTLRIIAGALVFQLVLTFWMLAFSMFMFLSLAFVKRYAELHEARNNGDTGKTRGRGYYADDLGMISSLGAASGYLSVMVLALYIQDQNTAALYRHPTIIWLACPLLLFWVSRIWMLTHRGVMHEDPVVFAVQDRVSLVVGGLFGLVFWLAT
jgi:4-hydroxybenzoate polyprenyltransferase